jgi:uncharacterized membrane protein
MERQQELEKSHSDTDGGKLRSSLVFRCKPCYALVLTSLFLFAFDSKSVRTASGVLQNERAVALDQIVDFASLIPTRRGNNDAWALDFP